MTDLRGCVVDVSDVTPNQRAQMYGLMRAHYECVERAVFDRDLAEKQWVILLVDEQQRVCGFSTQTLIEIPWEGRTLTALFSGDTIVDRDRWGRNPLSRTWGRFALSLIDRFPQGSLYWFLISKGYKTYRFLPLFFKKYFPDHRRTSEEESELCAAFARCKFPETYDAQAGVVRAASNDSRLKPGVADITPGRRRDPHIAFFERSNPDHQSGDELCCLAPLERDNFTPAAYRVMALPVTVSAAAAQEKLAAASCSSSLIAGKSRP